MTAKSLHAGVCERDTYLADLPDASIASRGFLNRLQL
jgi:hypothetical protein